jgi:hypothetical protein
MPAHLLSICRQLLWIGLFLAIPVLAQGAWVVELLVENSHGESQVLSIGAHPLASDGIDRDLGELPLPPPPPSSVFDARLRLPDLQETILDLRAPTLDSLNRVLVWQPGTEGYPIRISWDPNSLPDGLFEIVDSAGGVFVGPVDMTSTNEVIVGPDLFFLNSLQVVTQVDPLSMVGEAGALSGRELDTWAYPNPFNPCTVIGFSLTKEDVVVIEIFNLSGRRVVELIRESFSPGRHEITWNGEDQHGGKCAAGLYVCKVSNSQQSGMNKLLILK